MLVLLTSLILLSADSEVVSLLPSPVPVISNCSLPLGMQDGRISDSQITASSSYQETLVGPEKAVQLDMLIFSNCHTVNIKPAFERGNISTSLQYFVTFFNFVENVVLYYGPHTSKYDTFLTTRPPVKCKTNYWKLLTAYLGQLPPLLLINIIYIYFSPFNLTGVD